MKKLIAIILGLSLFYLILLLADYSLSQGDDALYFLSPLFNAIFRAANSLNSLARFSRPVSIPVSLIIIFSVAIIPLIRKQPGRWGLLLLFSSLAIAFTGNILLLSGFRTTGLTFYLAAMLMAGGSAIFSISSPANVKKSRGKIYRIGMPLIIIFTLLTGFYRLTTIPAHVSGYEANSGLSAIQLILNPLSNYSEILWPAMERSYSGSTTSPFFIYFLAGLFKASSANLLVLRSAGIFWGLVSLALLYLFIKTLFGERVALLSTFLTSVSPWFLSLMRLGNFASMSLCYFLLVLFLFYRALNGGYIYFLLTGAILSLFSYFYIPIKIIFPILALLSFHGLLENRGKMPKFLLGLGLLIGAFLLFSLPTGNPFTHIGGVSVKHHFIGSSYPDLGFSLTIAIRDLYVNLSTLLYNLFYRSRPILFPFPMTSLINRGVFLMAMLGLGWSIGRSKSRNYFFLTVIFFMALLPTLLLSPRFSEQPVARRCFLLAPVMASLAAVFLIAALNALQIFWRRKGSIIGLVLISLFLLGTALSDLNRYFNIQPHPAFMIKRTFADHCVNLLKEGYYLEIGQSDLHLRSLIDFLSYPQTRQLTNYYYFVGINSGHGLKYKPLRDNPPYHFWPYDEFKAVLQTTATSSRKTAIVFENETLTGMRSLLMEIREFDPQASIEPINDPEGRIIGFQYLTPQ